MPVNKLFLETVLKRFQYLKQKTEKAINQLNNDEDFFFLLDHHSNSIAILIRHLAGNMEARWSNPFISDGEESRNRPEEFNRSAIITKKELMQIWDNGWQCLFNTLNNLTPADLVKDIYIRGKRYSLLEAIQWQLSHYSTHIGQILFLVKHIKGDSWLPLDNLPTWAQKKS
ncbi:MAG: DUF1572 family protein [Candidatus Heimdallarchaeota archaeon]|nr:MAG: DUF1572 family protein [Candidatus Heimdallarchaeota archaeon]